MEKSFVKNISPIWTSFPSACLLAHLALSLSLSLSLSLQRSVSRFGCSKFGDCNPVGMAISYEFEGAQTHTRKRRESEHIMDTRTRWRYVWFCAPVYALLTMRTKTARVARFICANSRGKYLNIFVYNPRSMRDQFNLICSS